MLMPALPSVNLGYSVASGIFTAHALKENAIPQLYFLHLPVGQNVQHDLRACPKAVDERLGVCQHTDLPLGIGERIKELSLLVGECRNQFIRGV